MIALQPDVELIHQRIGMDDKAWKSHLAGVSRRYEKEFAALEGALLRNATTGLNGGSECLPWAMVLPPPRSINTPRHVPRCRSSC